MITKAFNFDTNFENLVSSYFPERGTIVKPPRLLILAKKILQYPLPDRSMIDDLRLLRIQAGRDNVPKVAEIVENYISDLHVFHPGNLPKDIWRLIFRKVHVSSLVALRTLNRAWKEGVSEFDLFEGSVRDHNDSYPWQCLFDRYSKLPDAQASISRLVNLFFQNANERAVEFLFLLKFKLLDEPENFAKALPSIIRVFKVSFFYPDRAVNLFKALVNLNRSIQIDKVILPSSLAYQTYGSLEGFSLIFRHSKSPILKLESDSLFSHWLMQMPVDHCIEYSQHLKTLEIEHLESDWKPQSLTHTPDESPRLPTVECLKWKTKASDVFESNLPTLNYHLPNLNTLELDLTFVNPINPLHLLVKILEHFTSLKVLKIEFRNHPFKSIEDIEHIFQLMAANANLEKIYFTRTLNTASRKDQRISPWAQTAEQYGLHLAPLTRTYGKHVQFVLSRKNHVSAEERPLKIQKVESKPTK